jgi:hypothetical protein
MWKYIQKFTGLFLAAFLLTISSVIAQAPLGFNYQGVALTNTGTPVNSKVISLRIALIESQQLGSVRYQEVHNVSTDSYGQFSIIIGNGQVVTGKMSDVQWSKFPYYMKVELDIAGGTAYVFVGTSQLLSVPYALYANNAGAASISVDSLKNEIATIKLIQKGDSIVLNNNRGGVFIPKIDSLSKIVSQIAGIKAGTIKYVKDSASKIPVAIGIGYDALKNFDSVAVNSANIAIGQSAGALLPKYSDANYNNDNVFIGNASGWGIGSSTGRGANQNIMLGNYTGQYMNGTAANNIIIGHEAGRFSYGTLGSLTPVFNQNVAIGSRSMQYAIAAESNVAIGSENFNRSKKVNRNVTIGNNMAPDYNGDDNIMIGSQMLTDTSSNGSKNVIIGAAVATNLRGSGNIILGYKAASDSLFLNTSNKLIIANDKTKTPLIYGEFDNKKITINGDLTVTGKLNGANGSSVSDSTIKALNKRIDSLVIALSTKSVGKIDSSNLAKINPMIVTKFLDSVFLPTINFDGSKSYINIGSTSLASTLSNSNLTFEFWVKNILKNSTNQTIFSTGYDMQGQGINVNLNAGRLTFSFNNFNHTIGIDYPDDSLWHHVAYTSKEKSTSTIYLDGIEKMRSNNVGLNIYSSQKLAIGATIQNTSPLDFYKGSLRKMRISKGVRYTSNFTPSYTYTKADSTIAFWELNDLGIRIKASDSAYNGTLYNGTWLIKDTVSGSVTVTTSVTDTLFNSPISVNGNVTSNNGDSIIQKGILFGTSSDLQLTGANQVNSYYPAPYPVDTNTYKWVMDYTNGGFINSVPMTGTPQFPQNNNGYILSLPGQGSFNIKILGTFGQIFYYVRTFAKTKNGVFYGNSVKVKTSNYSRDQSARGDFANVFWDNKFSLFDLLTDELILPDINGNYNIWYSTNENPTVNSIILSSRNPSSPVYKFKTRESCQRWCDYRTGKIKP